MRQQILFFLKKCCTCLTGEEKVSARGTRANPVLLRVVRHHRFAEGGDQPLEQGDAALVAVVVDEELHQDPRVLTSAGLPLSIVRFTFKLVILKKGGPQSNDWKKIAYDKGGRCTSPVTELRRTGGGGASNELH